MGSCQPYNGFGEYERQFTTKREFAFEFTKARREEEICDRTSVCLYSLKSDHELGLVTNDTRSQYEQGSVNRWRMGRYCLRQVCKGTEGLRGYLEARV